MPDADSCKDSFIQGPDLILDIALSAHAPLDQQSCTILNQQFIFLCDQRISTRPCMHLKRCCRLTLLPHTSFPYHFLIAFTVKHPKFLYVSHSSPICGSALIFVVIQSVSLLSYLHCLGRHCDVGLFLL